MKSANAKSSAAKKGPSKKRQIIVSDDESEVASDERNSKRRLGICMDMGNPCGSRVRILISVSMYSWIRGSPNPWIGIMIRHNLDDQPILHIHD